MSQVDETNEKEMSQQPQAGEGEAATAPAESEKPQASLQAGEGQDDLIRKLRAENASHRQKAKELKAELERTQRMAAARETLLRSGVTDVDHVISALAIDSVELEKVPEVVNSVLGAIRESLKPTLPPAVQPSPAAPPKPAALTLADVANMSEREINQRWAEVQEAIRKGL